MFNPYIIILSLFIIAGLFATLWGWRIIREGKKTLLWPKAQGSISKVEATSKADDLLPQIEFSYRVNNKDYQCTLNFPDSVSPSQELTNQYMYYQNQKKTKIPEKIKKRPKRSKSRRRIFYVRWQPQNDGLNPCWL